MVYKQLNYMKTTHILDNCIGEEKEANGSVNCSILVYYSVYCSNMAKL